MSLSAHLVDQYEDRKPIIPPYLRPNQQGNPNPNPMQVKQDPDQSWYTNHGDTSMTSNTSRVTTWSEERVEQLQARLRRKLGPEYVTQRPGPGGGPKLSYIEGWKVINLANEVFGFNGWSTAIQQLSVDFLDVNKEGRCSVNVTAIVRITLQDGCFHEDVGCGSGENIKGKASALDKAKKEAVTDATKRALKTFGNVLGNCLYDKDYAKEVVKMKVPPPKFNHNELERRPEFAPQPPPQGQGQGPGQGQAQAQPQAGPSRPPQAQPQAGPSRPAPPIVNNHQPQPPPRAGSPLKTVEEADAELDFHMSEAFDGEFLDVGGESFFDIVDTSVEKMTTSKPVQAEAGPSKPAYQYRHRPDQPPPAGAAARPPGAEVKRPFNRVASSEDAAARRLQAIMGDSAPPAIVAGNANPQPSSGGSSTTLTEGVKPRGGFNPQLAKPPTLPNPNAQSARALAIQSALRNGDGAGPIRSVSPQIPAGGVDAVAARATVHMKTYGQKLELEDAVKQVENSPAAGLGFTSARGMKRSISEDQRKGSVSPTKAGPGGPRQALGEINLDPGEYGAKRPRA